MTTPNEELCPDVPDSELREQLAACREDWQRVCDALGAKGEHMDPDVVVRAIAALARQEEGREAVAWQFRFVMSDVGYWSGWAQAQSEDDARHMVERYAALGQQAEWRALYTHPAPPIVALAPGGEGDAYAAGVKACIAWVEKRRHDFEAEYGTVDPTTNAMEFRNAALEEYDCELAEIEEGLRTLIATPTPQAGEADHRDWNRRIRDSVDTLLAQAGYAPDASARHQLSLMNFDPAPATPQAAGDRLCAPTGQPPKPWTSDEKVALHGALSDLAAREATAGQQAAGVSVDVIEAAWIAQCGAGWGLSCDDMLRKTFKPGAWGETYQDGETIYTHPEHGTELTAFMAAQIISTHAPFVQGYRAALTAAPASPQGVSDAIELLRHRLCNDEDAWRALLVVMNALNYGTAAGAAQEPAGGATPTPQAADAEEWEVRADGQRVRKDRWETGFRNIVGILVGARTEFEIPDIVERVRVLASASATPQAAGVSALAVLQGVRELAIKAAEHWDADEDMKVGKILMALAGQIQKYDPRADALEAALTAAGAAPEGWQPIETAPKDGTLYLCWVDAIRYGERDDGSLDHADVSAVDFGEWRDFGEAGGAHVNMMGDIGDGQLITHWMPLPARPAAQQPGAQHGQEGRE